MTSLDDAALDALCSDLQSQIGDDVQRIFLPEWVEAAARQLCLRDGFDPDYLEPGDAFPLPWMDEGRWAEDEYATADNLVDAVVAGEPHGRLWRQYIFKAKHVLSAVAPLIAADARRTATAGDVPALLGYESGFAAGRREALEEAARMVEGQPVAVDGATWSYYTEWPAIFAAGWTGNRGQNDGSTQMCKALAAAIRQLRADNAWLEVVASDAIGEPVKLRARVAELEAALRPLAKLGGDLLGLDQFPDIEVGLLVSLAAIAKARAALKGCDDG